MKRLLFRTMRIGGALVLLFVLALLLAAVEREPLFEREPELAPSAIAQARILFSLNDPRRLRPGEQRTVNIPIALIDQGINHLAERRWRGRGRFELNGGDRGELGLAIPASPWAGYFNLRATLVLDDGLPRLERASVGALRLPGRWLTKAAIRTAAVAGYGQEWTMARQAVRSVRFQPETGYVSVTYAWEPRILDRARQLAIPGIELPHLRAAQEQLAALLEPKSPAAAVPLPEILQPMLAADPRPERRRAAVLVLAVFLAEKNLAALAPAAGQWPHPRAVELTLRGRHDTAQHFIVSAALAAWADQPVADAVGLYKELDDARHGSGFSFADLAADKAGTRFGELIARNSPLLQTALATPLTDARIMPDQEHLPEFLDEPQFRHRYGGPDSPAYRQLLAEIERRVAQLPLYR